MIDLLHLRIPLKSESCISLADGSAVCDLDKYARYDGLTIRSQRGYENGQSVSFYEGHAFESLPSSYSGIAVCLRARGHVSFPQPFLEVKFSPAKILQGHNVFGLDSVRLGFTECLHVISHTWSGLFGDLDLNNAHVLQLDITYSARFDSPALVHQAKKALEDAGQGSVRRTRSYDSSVYWNMNSSHSVKKVYEKGAEVEREFQKYEKELKKSPNCERIKRVYSALDSVREYSKNLLRFEASIKKRFLEKYGIPTNIIDLIKREKIETDIYQKLWETSFDPIFKSLEGLTMPSVDENKICEKIDLIYTTQSASGRINRRKATAVRSFYFEVKARGLDAVKQSMAESTFYDNLNCLKNIGLSRAFIQSLGSANANVVPLVRAITINFEDQFPADYQAPKLQFLNNYYDNVRAI